MKKIVLIEDRPQRLKQFLDNKQIDELKESCTYPSEIIGTIKETLNNRDIPDNLKETDLVLFHRSALKDSGLETLIDHCEQNNIDLILFSGGVSQPTYDNREQYQTLIINSGDLYSNRLNNFLKKYTKGKITNLLEILYGEHWQLSILLLIRHFKLIMKDEEEEFRKEEINTNFIEKLSEIVTINGENIDSDINKIIEKI